MELNKPVRISEETLKKLKMLKIHPRQSYSEVIDEVITTSGALITKKKEVKKK